MVSVGDHGRKSNMLRGTAMAAPRPSSLDPRLGSLVGVKARVSKGLETNSM